MTAQRKTKAQQEAERAEFDRRVREEFLPELKALCDKHVVYLESDGCCQHVMRVINSAGQGSYELEDYFPIGA